MPYHYDDGNEYSYHNFNGGQWLDYSGGLIFGYWFNKVWDWLINMKSICGMPILSIE